MALAWHDKHVHGATHHRFWLILATLATFLLATLWAKPIG